MERKIEIYKYLSDKIVLCEKCGEKHKMPSHVYTIVAKMCPEADLMTYTLNCECGHKTILD